MSRESEELRRSILLENLRTHRIEAPLYDWTHIEIYNRKEQCRIRSVLTSVRNRFDTDFPLALDVGSGTGNLARKLRELGFRVVAFDLSGDMLQRQLNMSSPLEKEQSISLVQGDAENLPFGDRTFDFLGCYSTLHHIPDYAQAVREFVRVLKKDGMLYLDHEADESYWKSDPLLRRLLASNHHVLNGLYRWMNGIPTPTIDHTLSDYHTTDLNHIQWRVLRRICSESGIRIIKEESYHLSRTVIPDPISSAVKLLGWRDMRLLLGRKMQT